MLFFFSKPNDIESEDGDDDVDEDEVLQLLLLACEESDEIMPWCAGVRREDDVGDVCELYEFRSESE